MAESTEGGDLSCTIVPEQLERTFNEYIQLLKQDLTVQNLGNLTMTLFDTAARLWLYAQQEGVKLPPVNTFVRLAGGTLKFAIEQVESGASIIPDPPTPGN